MSIIQTLDEAAVAHPALRRYVAQGFRLARPVLSLELETGFDIESVNQTLRVNACTTDVRSVLVNPKI